VEEGLAHGQPLAISPEDVRVVFLNGTPWFIRRKPPRWQVGQGSP
jgi:hypothetical protein